MSLSTGVWVFPPWILRGFVTVMSLAWGVITGFVTKAIVQRETCQHFKWADGDGTITPDECSALGTSIGLGMGCVTALVP